MRAQELGELVYEPAAAADKLWRAIKYLFGVGMKTSSSDYLHSVENFEAFRREAKSDGASSVLLPALESSVGAG